MENVTNERKLTIPQFAEATGKSEQTVRKWIKEGKVEAALEPGPFGEQYMIPESEVSRPFASIETFTVQRPMPAHILIKRISDKVSEDLREQNTMLVEKVDNLEKKIDDIAKVILTKGLPKEKKGRRFWFF